MMNKKGFFTIDPRIIIWILVMILLYIFLKQINEKKEDISIKENKIKYNIPLSEEEIVEECAGVTPYVIASCLVEQINTFYKYTKPQIGDHLTFEQIKEGGGTCRDWSQLYERILKKINLKNIERGIDTQFYIKQITLQTNEYHQFLIFSNSESNSYCFIDMQEFGCRGGKTGGYYG